MSVLGALVCAYILVAAQIALGSRRAAYPDEYGQAALRNLSNFRSGLMSAWLARQQNHKYGLSYEYLGESGGAASNGGLTSYQLYNPVVSCPPWAPMQRYGGAGDGGKFLCSLQHLRQPCVIYSLGYGGNMDFEQDMLNNTPCSVHTFDCTLRPPHTIGRRHFFHDICIGNAPIHDKNNRNRTFVPFNEVVSTLGHARVDILKIDIEGSEYELLSSLHEKDVALPRQLAIEFHLQDFGFFKNVVVRDEIGLGAFMLHLANLGYAAFSREDNPIGNCCSELSFLRVEEPLSQQLSAGSGRHASTGNGTGWMQSGGGNSSASARTLHRIRGRQRAHDNVQIRNQG